MDLRVGTAGYSYPDWVGPVYPAGTGPNDMLAQYARYFSAVEINSTFYGPPTRSQLEKMARRVSREFGFSLKVPRTASHGRDSADLPAFKAAADHLSALGKLLGLLVQVPETFRNVAPNRDWLRHIGSCLRPHRVAVEFRHKSWDTPVLPAWMEAAELDLVSVGVPAIPTLYPAGLRVANRRVYARLHSQDAENWYAGGKERYNYDYPEPVIRKWARALKVENDAGRVDSAVVFFNNCVGGRAVGSARKLAAVVGQIAPEIAVVGPSAPVSAQRSLFGSDDTP